MSTMIVTTTNVGTDVAVEVVYVARGEYAVLVHDQQVGTVRGTGGTEGDLEAIAELFDRIGLHFAPIRF